MKRMIADRKDKNSSFSLRRVFLLRLLIMNKSHNVLDKIKLVQAHTSNFYL